MKGLALIFLLFGLLSFSEQVAHNITEAANDSAESSGDEITTTEAPETTTLSETASCIGDCPPVDPYYGAYLPNEDCSKFCQCSNGQLYVLNCPDNLQFNAALQVCDWPQSANCTGEGGIVVVPPVISNLPIELDQK